MPAHAAHWCSRRFSYVQYVTNKATRIRIRAVGELDEASQTFGGEKSDHRDLLSHKETPEPPKLPLAEVHVAASKIFLESYSPKVSSDGEWTLSEIDLEFISTGAYILGTGGGGSPYPLFVMSREIVRSGGSKIRVKDASSFSDRATVRMDRLSMLSRSPSCRQLLTETPP
jgi:hypothetical protein